MSLDNFKKSNIIKAVSNHSGLRFHFLRRAVCRYYILGPRDMNYHQPRLRPKELCFCKGLTCKQINGILECHISLAQIYFRNHSFHFQHF